MDRKRLKSFNSTILYFSTEKLFQILIDRRERRG